MASHATNIAIALFLVEFVLTCYFVRRENKIDHDRSQKWMHRVSISTLTLYASASLFSALTKSSICDLSIGQISIIRFLLNLTYNAASNGFTLFQIVKLQYCFGKKKMNIINQYAFKPYVFNILYLIGFSKFIMSNVSAFVAFRMETGPDGCTFVESGRWPYAFPVCMMIGRAWDLIVFMMYCRRIRQLHKNAIQTSEIKQLRQSLFKIVILTAIYGIKTVILISTFIFHAKVPFLVDGIIISDILTSVIIMVLMIEHNVFIDVCSHKLFKCFNQCIDQSVYQPPVSDQVELDIASTKIEIDGEDSSMPNLKCQLSDAESTTMRYGHVSSDKHEVVTITVPDNNH